MNDFDDDELSGLSDTERAALEDDDDEADILAGLAGDNDAGDDAGGSDDAGADDGADDGKTSGKAEAAPQGNADAGESADDGAPMAEFSPQFTAATTEGLAEKITDIDGRAAALLKSFQEGDIELSEFMAQNQALTDERLQVRMAEEQSKWAQSQNDAQRAQRWQWEQDRFFAQKESAIYKDPITLAALDASIKQLAAAPENARRPAGWFLEEADRQVRSRFGAATQTPTPSKDRRGRNAPDLSGVPRTLGGLPAAEMADTGADEFAHLDKLDGIALEAALRKMTPEQEARYLGAA